MDASSQPDAADLARRSCSPGAPKLPPERVRSLTAALPDWQLVDGRLLRRELRFDDFAGALAFVNRVGAEAEAQDHHPDLQLGWGRVQIEFTTHDAGGLTEADCIMAARIDALLDASS